MNKEFEALVSILTDEQKAELIARLSGKEVKATAKAETKEEEPKKKVDFNSLTFEEQVAKELTSIDYFKEHNKADDMQIKKCDPTYGVTFIAVFTSKWVDKKTKKPMSYRKIVVRLFDKSKNYGQLIADFAGIGCKEYHDKWNNKPLIIKPYSKELFDQMLSIIGSVMPKKKGTKAETPKVEEQEVEPIAEEAEVIEEVEDDTTDELEEEDVVEQVEEVVKPKAKKTTKEPTPSLKTANNIANFAKNIFANANKD